MSGKDKPFVVTNTAPRMISIAKQDIMPGKTSEPIDPKWIEGVKNSPPFRAGLLKEGIAPVPPSQPVDLAKLSDDQAIKMIAAEKDAKTLEAWSKDEKRPLVLKALADRVKSL